MLEPPNTAGVGLRLAAVRQPLMDGFLSGVDRPAAAAAMPRVAAGRLADPATTDCEKARIEAFIDDVSRYR